ncbi:hypothetical protein L6452_32531 [Arctium lappa]|uniref:Uncharacterized protein n=1 Tax=Arctium lappa TaxID=4217 RepID=A0ACB8Z643_ARCLA|nr:hypothetical protein L6452_32531 [Arctium lappa]
MEVLSNIGQEQLKRPHEVEAFMAANPTRPTYKWERSLPANVGQTGIKGSGILSSININGGRVEPAIGKQKSAICVREPGSSSLLR